MGIWIMTQGKLSLINANIISVCLSVVYGLTAGGEEVILGTYESEERAKEVLNEIQRHVTLLAQLNRAGLECCDQINPVYQMPEKKEEWQMYDWAEAEQYLELMEKEYTRIGGNGAFALTAIIGPLRDRYNAGERTEELYTEILDLE